LVYHLGGQTSEVTLVSIDDGVIEILAGGGNTHLGGEDFNQRVIMHILEDYKSKTGIDIRGNVYATGTLKREVERAKRTLSSQQSTRIEVDKIWSETITRLKFEELNDDLFRDTIQSVEQVLQEARIKKDEVHNVRNLITVTALIPGSLRIGSHSHIDLDAASS
jgi:heat shock protein 5